MSTARTDTSQIIDFAEICNELDNRKEAFIHSWKEADSIETVWHEYQNRNNTFLTMK